MKIGIIGSGNMGRSLGLVWAERGHEVFFGARSPEKAAEAASAAAVLTGAGAAGARHGSNQEAAQFGDVLVYSARGVPVPEALGETGPSVVAGKILLDLNNQAVPDDFAFPPIVQSSAEKLAASAPDARVVKAFNTLPMEVFELCPEAIRPYRVNVFVAGDDTNARQTVCDLAEEIGFVAIDCGPLIQARLLESAADLIRLLLIRQGLADVNFALAHVPDAEKPRLGGRQPSKLK